jgi:hypothetical protein
MLDLDVSFQPLMENSLENRELLLKEMLSMEHPEKM